VRAGERTRVAVGAGAIRNAVGESALARHSSIELTMTAYADVSLLDLKGAVAKIAGTAVASAQPTTQAKTA
jgi:hypothetical protein